MLLYNKAMNNKASLTITAANYSGEDMGVCFFVLLYRRAVGMFFISIEHVFIVRNIALDEHRKKCEKL